MAIDDGSSGSCFDRDTLATYTEGRLLDQQARAISLHLASCGRCVSVCESLHLSQENDRLAHRVDPLVAELRHLHHQHSESLAPECAQMIARALSLLPAANKGNAGTGDTHGNLSLDQSTDCDVYAEESKPDSTLR